MERIILFFLFIFLSQEMSSQNVIHFHDITVTVQNDSLPFFPYRYETYGLLFHGHPLVEQGIYQQIIMDSKGQIIVLWSNDTANDVYCIDALTGCKYLLRKDYQKAQAYVSNVRVEKTNDSIRIIVYGFNDVQPFNFVRQNRILREIK